MLRTAGHGRHDPMGNTPCPRHHLDDATERCRRYRTGRSMVYPRLARRTRRVLPRRGGLLTHRGADHHRRPRLAKRRHMGDLTPHGPRANRPYPRVGRPPAPRARRARAAAGSVLHAGSGTGGRDPRAPHRGRSWHRRTYRHGRQGDDGGGLSDGSPVPGERAARLLVQLPTHAAVCGKAATAQHELARPPPATTGAGGIQTPAVDRDPAPVGATRNLRLPYPHGRPGLREPGERRLDAQTTRVPLHRPGRRQDDHACRRHRILQRPLDSVGA